MISDSIFVQQSLTDNLYYLRTLKGFCVNIALSFFKNNDYYSKVSRLFGTRIEELGEITIKLANNRVLQSTLDSGSFVTPYSLESELQTERLFNIELNTDLTIEETKLVGTKNNNITVTKDVVEEVEELNKNVIEVAYNFIDFCTSILNDIKSNQLFSYSYISIYNFMLNEAGIFITDLERLQNKNSVDPTYINDFEYLFSDSMRQFCQFIRGLSNPNQNSIIINSDNYNKLFTEQMRKYKDETLSPETQVKFNNETLGYVESFSSFVEKILKGILNGDYNFIAEPVFFDNMLTEINYFKYLLKSEN